MSLLRKSILTVGAVTAALAPAAAAQAATVLSTEQAPTHVAAWNGTVMWSQLDAATGDYRLVKSVAGGAPTPVAVPERAGGPFDIDLGTNRSGSTYAVYTRGGDIYRLGVASGVETLISRLSSPTLAERDPTIQRGEIAFIRPTAASISCASATRPAGRPAPASWSRSARSSAPSSRSSRWPTSSCPAVRASCTCATSAPATTRSSIARPRAA